jgi:hypothetical protein
MSRLMTMVIVLTLAGVTTTIAQNANSSSGRMQWPSGSGSGASAIAPPAPVGHRQPTRADISTVEPKNGGLLGPDEAEKELDRKIKNICRGC